MGTLHQMLLGRLNQGQLNLRVMWHVWGDEKYMQYFSLKKVEKSGRESEAHKGWHFKTDVQDCGV
jgi:hypothetical protein